jgi:Na+/proline symporter
MSSLDSSMNSMSAAVVTDFYRRFRKGASEASCLRLAKVVTALAGLLGTAFALTMAGTNIKSVWDQFNVILGLFGGPLAGLFLLGAFSRRANAVGAMAGLACGAVTGYVIQEFTDLHFYLYGSVAMFSCMIAGYIASRLAPAGQAPAGMTAYDVDKLTAGPAAGDE